MMEGSRAEGTHDDVIMDYTKLVTLASSDKCQFGSLAGAAHS